MNSLLGIRFGYCYVCLLQQEMIRKTVFVVMFQGDQLMAKVRKISEGFVMNVQIVEILWGVYGILSGGTSVVFRWVPSHVGVAGDSNNAEKAALLIPVSNLTIGLSDYHSRMHTQALKQWQLRWNYETQNKLHVIVLRANVFKLLRLPHRD